MSGWTAILMGRPGESGEAQGEGHVTTEDWGCIWEPSRQSTRRWKRQEGPSSVGFQGSPALQTPWSPTSDPQTVQE